MKISYEECKDIWRRSIRIQMRWNNIVDFSANNFIDIVCRRLNLVKAKHQEEIRGYYKRFMEERI